VVVVGLGQVQLGEDGADVFSTVPSVTHSRRPMSALEGHGQSLFRRDTSLRARANCWLCTGPPLAPIADSCCLQCATREQAARLDATASAGSWPPGPGRMPGRVAGQFAAKAAQKERVHDSFARHTAGPGRALRAHP
jgi:hypothetical protein